MSYATDSALVYDLRKGGEEAFQYCYTEFLPLVRNWFKTQKVAQVEADDLFQEALLVVYDNVRKSDFQLQSKLSTYILSICKYMWYNRSRKLSAMKTDNYGEEVEVLKWVEQDMEFFQQQEEHYLKLQEALDELGEPCKGLLEAYYVQDLSMKEISEMMEYTNANNAKTQKYKCLNRLKKIFKDKLKKNNEQFRTV